MQTLTAECPPGETHESEWHRTCGSMCASISNIYEELLDGNAYRGVPACRSFSGQLGTQARRGVSTGFDPNLYMLLSLYEGDAISQSRVS